MYGVMKTNQYFYHRIICNAIQILAKVFVIKKPSK